MSRFKMAAILLTLGLTIAVPTIAKPGKNQGHAGKVLTDESIGWYLSVDVGVSEPVSGATYRATNQAVLGMLPDSVAGYDLHDIPAFASLASSKIAAVFVHEDWEERAGEYHSDYRGNRKHDSWLLHVNSSVSGGQVSVSWDGIYDVVQQAAGYGARRNHTSDMLEDLYLVDLVTLEVIPALQHGRMNAYEFTMAQGETSRQLRWVLGPLKGKYFEPGEGAMRYLAEQRRALRAQEGNSKGNSVGQSKGASKPHPVFGLPPGQ